MAQSKSFTCVIEDFYLHDRFSAQVVMAKKQPVRISLQDGKIDLVDIYITPISNQILSVHNHFVLYDCTGHGLYIVRDRYRKEIHRRECTVWDLGQAFGNKVLESLKEFF